MSLLKRIGGTQPPNDTPSAGTGAAASPANPATPPQPAVQVRAATPPPASPAQQPQVAQSVAAQPGATEVSDQRMLELSLWIVDRIQGSLG
ncbi:MAG: hypothetical protein RLZZ387_4374, partial [Chloroflexota bacterium]